MEQNIFNQILNHGTTKEGQHRKIIEIVRGVRASILSSHLQRMVFVRTQQDSIQQRIHATIIKGII